MFDLFKKKPKAKKEEDQTKSSAEEQEDMLDETGTFMLDVNKLKDCDDLEDLLNDV